MSYLLQNPTDSDKKMVYIIANLFNFVVQKRKLFHLNGITSLHYFVKIALAFCKWTVVNWDDVKRQRGTNYEWFDRTFVVYVMWEIYAELYSLWRDTSRNEHTCNILCDETYPETYQRHDLAERTTILIWRTLCSFDRKCSWLQMFPAAAAASVCLRNKMYRPISGSYNSKIRHSALQ